jgi:hypothetical protein
MSCERVQEQISSYLDGSLSEAEEKFVMAHFESCRICSARRNTIETLRAKLRGMSEPPLPARLAIQLRVLASHERVRQLARASCSARVRYWGERAKLQFDNLMRPVALPVAGGLLSALLLFGVLVPNLSFAYQVGGDPPLSIRTDPYGVVVDADGITAQHLYESFRDLPRLEPVNADTSGDETVVELTIVPACSAPMTSCNRGVIANYAVRQGELTPDILNLIMFSQFIPATFFYQPVGGKLLVTLPRRRNARS